MCVIGYLLVKGKISVEIFVDIETVHNKKIMNRGSGVAILKTAALPPHTYTVGKAEDPQLWPTKNRKRGSWRPQVCGWVMFARCFRKSADLSCMKQSQKPSNIGNFLRDGAQNSWQNNISQINCKPAKGFYGATYLKAMLFSTPLLLELNLDCPVHDWNQKTVLTLLSLTNHNFSDKIRKA